MCKIKMWVGINKLRHSMILNICQWCVCARAICVSFVNNQFNLIHHQLKLFFVRSNFYSKYD